jgi:hypothetical protein
MLLARSADASRVRAPLSGPGFGRTVAPFIGVVLLALSATALTAANTNWSLVVIAAGVAAAALAVAFGASRLKWHAASLLLLPIAIDAVLGLLRQAQGGVA